MVLTNLCDDLEGWDGVMGRRHKREGIDTDINVDSYDRFTLFNGGNQHDIVGQLSSNGNFKKKKLFLIKLLLAHFHTGKLGVGVFSPYFSWLRSFYFWSQILDFHFFLFNPIELLTLGKLPPNIW